MLKKEILDALKKTNMDLDLLIKYLESDSNSVKSALDELITEGKITITKGGKYKILKNNKIREENLDKDYIYNLIRNEHIFKIQILQAKCNTTRSKIERVLFSLEEESKIYFINKSTVSYRTIGILSLSDSGHGFVRCEGENEDFHVYPEDIGNAYDGDTVSISPSYDGNARIDSIIKRAHEFIVGELKVRERNKKLSYRIKSTQNKFNVMAIVNENDLLNAIPGMIVKAKILKYNNNGTLDAKIEEIIGYKDDPGMEISKIALEFGFNLHFNDEVKEEVKTIPNKVLENELNGRRDFRNLNIITIDGDDSKDFDDAVYLEVLPNGNYMLGVYIADVSHYVKEASPLDNEALSRGTSLYLADRVIPMLPHELSNGICSLNPGVDRLVLACIMEYNPNGKLMNYDICEGVINSHHRMTYNKVNKILDGDKELCNEYNDIVPMLNEMNKFSKVLRNIRFKRGGIEFDTIEYSFKLDDLGKPIEIIKRERADSEKLIEDFMLAANETVAYHMNIMNLPIVYRIHEKPDQEKLHNTIAEIINMGVSAKKTQNDIHPKEIQTILASVDDNPNKYIINNMLLRSMMKAKYSSENLGHYGLALNYYCHFTSPIRRYPDLMTHRMVKRLLLHPTNKFEYEIKKYSGIIVEVSLKTSSSERRAVDCERSVDDMLYAWYMEGNIGKIYNGIITSITAFGIFVEIENGIEGLILYKNQNEFYDYDEKNHIAISGKNIYKLGDKVRVKCVSASRFNREIDFKFQGGNNEDYMSE